MGSRRDATAARAPPPSTLRPDIIALKKERPAIKRALESDWPSAFTAIKAGLGVDLAKLSWAIWRRRRRAFAEIFRWVDFSPRETKRFPPGRLHEPYLRNLKNSLFR